jgi:NAD(P)H-hydrate repair Nnr-like enzyme with NAD(P)H-hydrate epimerase domain
MGEKHDLKPSPFCGCESVNLRPTVLEGEWVTCIDCGACPAQMMSDSKMDAIVRWNARAYDPAVRRAVAHMKQMEWERDQAVSKLEKAQLIIDLGIGGGEKEEVAEAIAILKAQGIEVAVDPSGACADAYIATLPNGDEYEFLAAAILKLKSEERLTAAELARTCKRC